MKKNILLIFLVIFVSLVIFADSENYYWYRSSEGEKAGAFPDIVENPDDPGDGPWIPTDPNYPGDSIYWVLFAVNGNIAINNTATLRGTPGWSIGSNSSPQNKVVITNNPNIYNDSFYIGPGAIASQVIQGVLGTRDWWADQGEPKKSFYEKLMADGFHKLTQRVNFNDPSIGFPLTPEHFYPSVLNQLEEKEDLITTWDSNIIIEENGYYNNITINSNREITLRVGEDDLVLKIDNLSISGRIKIESTVANPGRVFFFVNNSSTIGSSSQIGNSGLAENTHFFYTGSNDLNISGSASLYGTVYSLDAKVNLTGSGGVKNILSISDKEINFSPSGQIALDSIYAKLADITVGNTGKINDGIVTGGSNVNVTNVNSFHYIYAPKALITFGNTGHYVGSFIGDRVIIDNVVTIEGPPILEIVKPTIPQPIIGNETYTLTLQPNQEGAATLTGGGEYSPGEIVEITCDYSADDYEFVNWTDQDGNIVSETEDFEYTMTDEDMTLTANFNKLYNLEIIRDPQAGGIVTGGGKYIAGESVELDAAANDSYSFDGWYDEDDNLLSDETAYTFEMPEEDVTIKAKFNSGSGDWFILTKTGYDLSNNIVINGGIAVYETRTVEVKNHTTINGDIIVHQDGLMFGHTINEIDDHNGDEYDAYLLDFELPVCNSGCTQSGTPYDDDEFVHITSHETINGDLCVPNADRIQIDAHAVINGNIIAANATHIHLNGNTTVNGNIIIPEVTLFQFNGQATINGNICAPKATLKQNGQADIATKGMYINFLDMKNGSITALE